MHVDWAVLLPKVPGKQSEHTPAPLTLYFPAGQTTADAFVDPLGQAYPAVQLPVHAADFVALLLPYRPALQFVHDPAPDKLYVPFWHSSAVALVDPSMHAYPAVQLPVQAAVVRPEVLPNVPAGHSAVHVAS
jgi:hypothetical protein